MKLKKFRDWRALLVRAWAAGAVCFFAAWGRSGAEEITDAYSVDLIGGLIVVLVLADWILVNPVIKLLFNIQMNPAPKPGTGMALYILSHILKNIVIVCLIVGTYYVLNVFCITVFHFDEKSVPIPLEPVLFGILYGVYYGAGAQGIGIIKKHEKNYSSKELG
ncbi:MAG: hypothetical protein LBT13_09205 [Treponema sp.]|jgi:uncharacterized membrane protein HdeD (DUF308 family)|nr:hypothetical protein [Treponema sp.]